MSPSLEHFLSSTLRCCGWAYGCILIDVLHVQVGVNFWKIGAWLSLSDIVVSWLRLQTPKDCIPQPWYIYAMCFSSLRCCGWEFGYARLMSYYMCRWGWGWILGEMGNGWACMMLRCHGWGCKPPLTASHIHIPYWMYTKCLSTLRCCGWEFGYALMPYYMCRWGWIFGNMGNGRDCMMLQCHGWGYKPPKTASHIHIGCIKVF